MTAVDYSLTGRDYLSSSLTIHLRLRMENPDRRASLQWLLLTLSWSDLHLRSTDTSLIMWRSKGPPSTVAGGEKFHVKACCQCAEWFFFSLSFESKNERLQQRHLAWVVKPSWHSRARLGLLCVGTDWSSRGPDLLPRLFNLRDPREERSQSVVSLIELHTRTLVE